MRQLKISFVILLLLALFLPEITHAQVTDSESRDKNRRVYWFNINLSFKTDSKTGLPKYDVHVLTSKVYHGSLEKYDRTLWKGLGAGTRVSIGPFSFYEEAQQAMAFYSLKHESAPIDTSYDKNRSVNFYNLFIGKRPRSGSYFLDRRPAAVSSGSYEDFYDLLKVSLQFSSTGGDGVDLAKLTIGPFWEHIDAEESKRIYRLH